MKIRFAIILLLTLSFALTACTAKQKSKAVASPVAKTAPQTFKETTAETESTTEKSTEAVSANETEVLTTLLIKEETVTSKTETTTLKPTEKATEKPTETTRPVTTKPVETTKETTTSKQVIDIDYYINFATEYGKNIGLKYLAEANECWDTPIIIASDNHDSAIRDIQSRLNRYKNIEGDEYFCLWAEKRGNGIYELYIGYS
jgi:hypothetical protein